MTKITATVWINSTEQKDVNRIKHILHMALLSEFARLSIRVGDTFHSQKYQNYAAKIEVDVPILGTLVYSFPKEPPTSPIILKEVRKDASAGEERRAN